MLQKLSKQYEVSDSEIIRTVMERVLGNRKFEKLLIHDVYKDLVNNDKELILDDSLNEDLQESCYNIPEKCPECGEKEDITGKSVISVNQATKTWSCSNCFSSGLLINV